MKSYCYICGSDSDVRECPKCGNGFCCDCFSKTKDQETGAPICFDCEIDNNSADIPVNFLFDLDSNSYESEAIKDFVAYRDYITKKANRT